MDLLSALKQPEFTNLVASDALALLTAIVPNSGDNTPYTWPGIGKLLLRNGLDPNNPAGCQFSDWALFNSGLASLTATIGGNVINVGASLANCLTSNGFDCSDPFNRAQIAQLELTEPSWAVNVLNAMLALGAPRAAWQVTYQLDTLPTTDQITTALAQIVTQQHKQLFVDLYNNAVARMDSNEFTFTQALAYMGAGVL